MTEELPLKVQVVVVQDKENTIDFIVGETEEYQEPAGRLTVYDIGGFDVSGYTPFTTKKINSFHIEKDLYGNATIRELEPCKEVMMKNGDSIGWGHDEPIVSIEFNNKAVN